MNFKIGDRVKFLNDTGGGKITRLESSGRVYVMTEDGFEMPVMSDELIPDRTSGLNPHDIDYDEPVQAVKADVKVAKAPKTAAWERNTMPEAVDPEAPVLLAIGLVPEEINAIYKSAVNCFIINDSPYLFYYRIGYQQQGNYYFINSGEAEPNTKCFVTGFSQTDLSKATRLHLQAMAVSTGLYRKMAPVDRDMDIKGYDFGRNQTYRDNDYFDDRALILECFATERRQEPDFAGKTEHNASSPAVPMAVESAQPKRNVDTMEVDLHIESLIESYKHLTNGEILKIQMNRFRNSLEEAISAKVRRIVLIHGVGNGTLKLEIRNELKRNFPEYAYQDASFKEYGFGATMVYLK
jgi:hypothetical protein